MLLIRGLRRLLFPSLTPSLIYTAQLCAASRALESSLPVEKRLFNDPYAAQLAGAGAVSLAKRRAKEERGKSLQPRIAIRTKYFDDFIVRCVRNGARTVISLGAGLETRAYRLGLEGVKVYEVDVWEVFDRKRRVLKDVQARGERVEVVGDVRQSGWFRGLKGYDGGCTVFVMEGLLYYLEEARVMELLKECALLGGSGSWVGGSVVKELKNRGGLAKMFVSAMPDPKVVLEQCGWSHVQVAQLGAEVSYGRWQGNASNTYYFSAMKP